MYKTKIIGRKPANSRRLNTKIVVPLKYLSNSWRSLDLPFINCGTEVDLTWLEDCTIPEILNNVQIPGNPSANQLIQRLPEGSTTGATFQINSAFK